MAAAGWKAGSLKLACVPGDGGVKFGPTVQAVTASAGAGERGGASAAAGFGFDVRHQHCGRDHHQSQNAGEDEDVVIGEDRGLGLQNLVDLAGGGLHWRRWRRCRC